MFTYVLNFRHEVAEVAGLASFSFGQEEVDRCVIVWKKVKLIECVIFPQCCSVDEAPFYIIYSKLFSLFARIRYFSFDPVSIY